MVLGAAKVGKIFVSYEFNEVSAVTKCLQLFY